MCTPALALLIVLMTFGTYSIANIANYQAVFVQEGDVLVLSTTKAKSSIQCAILYQPQETRVSLFRYEKEAETCLIGELKQNATVDKTSRNPGMIQFFARHEVLLGGFNVDCKHMPTKWWDISWLSKKGTLSKKKSAILFFYFTECPEGFSWFNRSCFTLADPGNTLSHPNAAQECASLGSTIGSLHSSEEEDFVLNGNSGKVAREFCSNCWVGYCIGPILMTLLDTCLY